MSVPTASRGSSRRLLPQLALLAGGLALGAVLIVVLLRSVDLARLGTDFTLIDPRWMILAVPFFAGNLLLKVPRWQLLYGEGAPGFDTLFGAMNVGYAVNSLLPLRLGEVVRAYWVRDRAGISMVRTLSTIALERVLDGLTVLLLFLALAPTVAFPAALRGSALGAGAIFIVVLLGMLAVAYGVSREGRIAQQLRRLEEGRWAPVARIVQQLANGLHALRNGRALLLAIGYTLLIWACNAVLLWVVLRAFHLDTPLAAGALGNAVVSLGMAVPSTPGYLGVFDYLMVVTLGLYGIHRTAALAASLVFHAIAFVPVTLIGLYYLARYGWQATRRMLVSTATRSGASAGTSPIPEYHES